MENFLFSHVKSLYDNELYSSVIRVASLLSTVFQNDHTSATPEMEYQVLLFQGNSFYNERRFRLAVKYLHAALLTRKAFVRNKNPNLAAIESEYEHFTDIETKYRLAKCYVELSELDLAIGTLQTISTKSRTPKINALLGKLFLYNPESKSSDAIAAYKDVLRDCPLTLDALSFLLELGEDGVEVNSLIVNVSSVPKNIEWLSSWIKGHAQMYGRNHLEASKTFQSIDENPKFHQNEYILSLIGKCLYYNGNFPQAERYLEMSTMISPNNTEAIMPLAAVYEYNNKKQELFKLTGLQTNINEFTSENWFVLAQGLAASGKREKAIYFTHRAITAVVRNVEAYLLRGRIYLQMKRFKDAINFFRTVEEFANYRFEIYKGLFGCYTGLKRFKEAQTVCALATRYFHHSPRSYVLLARTLLNASDSHTKKQAKSFVTKALEIDEYYYPAVATMVEILQSEGETQEAIKLIKKQIDSYPSSKLFITLAEILSNEKDLEGAFENYTRALSMEPSNLRALEGINALGLASRMNSKDGEKSPASTSQDEEWAVDDSDPTMEKLTFLPPTNLEIDNDSGSDPIWLDIDSELTT